MKIDTSCVFGFDMDDVPFVDVLARSPGGCFYASRVTGLAGGSIVEFGQAVRKALRLTRKTVAAMEHAGCPDPKAALDMVGRKPELAKAVEDALK